MFRKGNFDQQICIHDRPELKDKKSENISINSLFSLILAFSAKQPTGSDATSS